MKFSLQKVDYRNLRNMTMPCTKFRENVILPESVGNHARMDERAC